MSHTIGSRLNFVFPGATTKYQTPQALEILDVSNMSKALLYSIEVYMTEPFQLSDVVLDGTSLGLILRECELMAPGSCEPVVPPSLSRHQQLQHTRLFLVRRRNNTSWEHICNSATFEFNTLPLNQAASGSVGCWRVTTKDCNVCMWDVFISEATYYTYMLVVTIGAPRESFAQLFGNALIAVGYTNTAPAAPLRITST